MSNAAAAFLLLLLAAVAASAQGEAPAPPPQSAPAQTVSQALHEALANRTNEMVVEGEQAGDVFGVGRSVRVRGTVKQGVMAFGGDVVVEGRVEGDVATVGGSVSQAEGSYIGGDVMVLGGAYHHGKAAPGRNPASKTIMFAGYEQELRALVHDPAQLLRPNFSLGFFGLRLLAILFWFVVSLALTAVTPGSVGRAAARLQLTSLRVALIGLLGALVLVPGVIVSLHFLPPVLGLLVGFTALILLLLSYLFGRVVIHAATGRWLQRSLLREESRSESVALLLGAAFWAVALVLPYVWPVVVAGLVVTSLGLALTARYRVSWKRD
ncbi:MAG TPA: polymer-forming cytoskeletal protein [Pyrinomonadaceae bacterium]